MRSIRTMLIGMMLVLVGLFIIIFFLLYGTVDIQGLIAMILFVVGIIIFIAALIKKKE